MELKSFISETLLQLVEGVKEAQGKAKEHGGIVNPKVHITPKDARVGFSKESVHPINLIYFVHFDIAITAVEGKETNGGIGVFVGAVGLGSQGHSEESNTTHSKINFDLAVQFPSPD